MPAYLNKIEDTKTKELDTIKALSYEKLLLARKAITPTAKSITTPNQVPVILFMKMKKPVKRSPLIFGGVNTILSRILVPKRH